MKDPSPTAGKTSGSWQRLDIGASAPRLLVVEDEPNDVFLLRRAFATANFPCSIEVVRDGQEAREFLERVASAEVKSQTGLPAIVILDLKMPRLDGFEFLQWMREQAQFRRVVTIVLSTSGRPEDVNRAYDLGANCFLQKPVGGAEYLQMVRNLYDFWIKTNRLSPGLPR